MKLSKKLFAAAVAVPLVLAGCSTDNGSSSDDNSAENSPNTNAESSQAPAASRDATYAVVTHGVQGDTFWDVVKSGAAQAEADLGITVTYQGDGDPVKQSQLIASAVADKVDGLIVSVANADGLRQAITEAVAAGIPVITINSGAEVSKELGAITHVGQSEFPAGQGAGEQFNAAGATKIICVIHEAGNTGLEDRCRGAADTFSGTVENLQVDVANVADAQNTIKSKLLADSAVDGVLTLNPGVAVAAAQAIEEAGSSAKLGTFDVSEDITTMAQEDKILFAIDQQPYLQGYLPVVFLELLRTNGNTVGGGQPVYSGPGYITKENAAQVAEFAKNGTR